MSNYVNNKTFNTLLEEYEKCHIVCPNEDCGKKIKIIETKCAYCGTKLKPKIKGADIVIFEKRFKILYNKIGNIFLLIAKNLLNKSSFINYTNDRKDEMISNATFFMCNYIDRFDVTKGNPFAYFTRVAFNAFLQNINGYNELGDIFTSLEYIDNFSECEFFENRKIENE